MPAELPSDLRDHPDYSVLIEPMAPEDGGGYLATVPDLPGCMSDGETREMAARNVGDAIKAWIEEAFALGRPIPVPSRRLVPLRANDNETSSPRKFSLEGAEG